MNGILYPSPMSGLLSMSNGVLSQQQLMESLQRMQMMKMGVNGQMPMNPMMRPPMPMAAGVRG